MALHYRIRPLDPAAHLFEASCRIDAPAGATLPELTLALPAWIPGSYMIRDFARHIIAIGAHCENGRRRRPVAIEKIDSHSWRSAACTGTLVVTWTVYAWDLSVRAAHLDQSHGFFNATSVFLRVVGRDREAVIVDIEAPADPACGGWRVATTLPEAGARRHGFGTYRADDYDALADHPVEMGKFALGHFEAAGVPHELAITGRVPNLDMARLEADLARVCAAQIRMFEPRAGKAPFERFLFLITALGDGYGGLEHRDSTALICKRDDLPAVGEPAGKVSEGYGNFLGLASHEYFHSWNVKRIKPAEFAPYRFERETHTRLLWIFEGFTSYYDDLLLRRAGLIDVPAYLERVAKTASTVLRGSGRLRQSVAESSFDAWTKYYRQDENSPNAIVSYYTKGSLVALALDLHLRAATRGRKSLDDVMRLLWRRYGRDFYPDNTRGLGESEFPALVEEATGVDVRAEVTAWAYGRDDLPLAGLLAAHGIAWSAAAESAVPTLGVKLAANEPRLATVHDGSAARAAGLSAGDLLVALDGLRVTAGNLDTLLKRYQAGQKVPVHAFRRDELLSFTVTLGAAPLTRISLKTVEKGKNAGAWRAWLGASR